MYLQPDVNIVKEIKVYLVIKDYLAYEAQMAYPEIWAQRDPLDPKAKKEWMAILGSWVKKATGVIWEFKGSAEHQEFQ